jgi:hypothetical protein
MRRNSWKGLLVVGLGFASVFAQQAAPANPASAVQIVQVRTGRSCGLCGGYSESVTAIGPDWIVRTDQSPAEKRKYPDRKLEYTISTPDWEELQRYIDTRVLSAFVGAIGQCHLL